MRRLPQPFNDELLKKLWPTDLTDDDLAENLGHGRGALRRRAKALGLPLRRNIRVQRAREELHEHR